MDVAALIRSAFEFRQESFRAITRRAPGRFEDRNWHAAQADAAERLEVYRRVVSRTVTELRTVLGEHLKERGLWARLKRSYTGLVAGRPDRDLAETFFNSVARRVFPHAGVDPAVEFVEPTDGSPLEPTHPAEPTGIPEFVSFPVGAGAVDLVERMLRHFAFRSPWRSFQADARAAGAEIDRAVAAWPGPHPLESAEVLDSIFYRGKEAYLVGRLRGSGGRLPLVVCLHHGDEGPFVDALLTDLDSAAIVFSYHPRLLPRGRGAAAGDGGLPADAPARQARGRDLHRDRLPRPRQDRALP